MRYQFVVRGPVPDAVAADLPELSRAASPNGGTAFFGPVRDESDVSTILALILSHGLSVIEVRPLPD